MTRRAPVPAIRLRGVRHNNLKNFDLDLPRAADRRHWPKRFRQKFLAFDTLYAEGQRRYIETFSPYARQFFDRMDKPQVDSISGHSSGHRHGTTQRRQNDSFHRRHDDGDHRLHEAALAAYLEDLIARDAASRCRKIRRRRSGPNSPNAGAPSNHSSLSNCRLSEKLSFEESLGLLLSRVISAFSGRRSPNPASRRSASNPRSENKPQLITVVQDRVKLESRESRAFRGSMRTGLSLRQRKLLRVFRMSDWTACRFSKELHCAECDIEYRAPSPALFSFNNPVGACPSCKGFGRVIGIDYNLAIPDRSLTLADGAVKPWQTETGMESQRDLR